MKGSTYVNTLKNRPSVTTVRIILRMTILISKKNIQRDKTTIASNTRERGVTILGMLFYNRMQRRTSVRITTRRDYSAIKAITTIGSITLRTNLLRRRDMGVNITTKKRTRLSNIEIDLELLRRIFRKNSTKDLVNRRRLTYTATGSYGSLGIFVTMLTNTKDMIISRDANVNTRSNMTVNKNTLMLNRYGETIKANRINRNGKLTRFELRVLYRRTIIRIKIATKIRTGRRDCENVKMVY